MKEQQRLFLFLLFQLVLSKNTLFLLAGFCFLSEFLERERMSYEEKERDGGNEKDEHTESIRVFGDYYACVFGHLCLCGLKFKEDVDYVQVELIYSFLKILLFNPK